jgi:predicted DNA-binding transcriptional regulator AlpA
MSLKIQSAIQPDKDFDEKCSSKVEEKVWGVINSKSIRPNDQNMGIEDEQEKINFERLWRFKDVAEYLQLSEHTLRRLTAGNFIPHVKFYRAVRFQPGVIRNWVESKVVKI